MPRVFLAVLFLAVEAFALGSFFDFLRLSSDFCGVEGNGEDTAFPRPRFGLGVWVLGVAGALAVRLPRLGGEGRFSTSGSVADRLRADDFGASASIGLLVLEDFLGVALEVFRVALVFRPFTGELAFTLSSSLSFWMLTSNLEYFGGEGVCDALSSCPFLLPRVLAGVLLIEAAAFCPRVFRAGFVGEGVAVSGCGDFNAAGFAAEDLGVFLDLTKEGFDGLGDFMADLGISMASWVDFRRTVLVTGLLKRTTPSM